MTTKEFIDEVMSSGHFDVEMPDGSCDDYDTSVPDYLVRQMFKGKDVECEDSNGSEQEVLKVDGDKMVIRFHIDGRTYSIDGGKNYGWEEAVVDCNCLVDGYNEKLVVKNIIKFEVDGDDFLGKLNPKKSGGIDKRWMDRVVANGWDKMGEEGARLYLAKYGKNIGDEKREALAKVAEENGCGGFAIGMRGK